MPFQTWLSRMWAIHNDNDRSPFRPGSQSHTESSSRNAYLPTQYFVTLIFKGRPEKSGSMTLSLIECTILINVEYDTWTCWFARFKINWLNLHSVVIVTSLIFNVLFIIYFIDVEIEIRISCEHVIFYVLKNLFAMRSKRKIHVWIEYITPMISKELKWRMQI